MKTVLAAKLALDGVEYDEFVLKDNLRNILRGRFRALRAQIPYKLPAMLASRCENAAPCETLFGDDAEADAIIYCLYADLVEGRVPVADLQRILEAARAYPDEIERTIDLARRVPKGPVVKRILIHLDRRSAPQGFRRYGRRLVPVFNYFQGALVLYADGVLSARQVMFVALEMIESGQYELATLANSMQDLLRRGRLDRDTALRLADDAAEAAASGALADHPALPPFETISERFRERIRQLGGAPPLGWTNEDDLLDYVALVDEEHANRRERRRRGTP
jgi:hypothetical protein